MVSQVTCYSSVIERSKLTVKVTKCANRFLVVRLIKMVKFTSINEQFWEGMLLRPTADFCIFTLKYFICRFCNPWYIDLSIVAIIYPFILRYSALDCASLPMLLSLLCWYACHSGAFSLIIFSCKSEMIKSDSESLEFSAWLITKYSLY